MSEMTPEATLASGNKQAGASLILGSASISMSFFNLLPGLLNIVGIITPVAALLAIYAGVRGLIAAQKSDGRGRTMAIGGLVAAIIAVVLFALLVGQSPAAKESKDQLAIAAVSGAIKSGDALFQKQDYDGAITEFNRALEWDPDSAAAYSYRGFAYGAKGDLKQALADFEQALAFDPDSAVAYYHRGTIYLNAGQLDQAIADLDLAIALDATIFGAHNNRCMAHNLQGQLEQAVADCDRAIELDPGSATAYTNRGSVYGNLGELDQAIADFDRAIELDPGFAQAYLGRGIARSQAGNAEQAIDDWRDFLSISSDPAMRVYAEHLLGEAGASE